MQQFEIWLLILFLSRKKFPAWHFFFCLAALWNWALLLSKQQVLWFCGCQIVVMLFSDFVVSLHLLVCAWLSFVDVCNRVFDQLVAITFALDFRIYFLYFILSSMKSGPLFLVWPLFGNGIIILPSECTRMFEAKSKRTFTQLLFNPFIIGIGCSAQW